MSDPKKIPVSPTIVELEAWARRGSGLRLWKAAISLMVGEDIRPAFPLAPISLEEQQALRATLQALPEPRRSHLT